MSRARLLTFSLAIAAFATGGVVTTYLLGSRVAPPPPPAEPPEPAYFEDVTARTGIAFTYHNGEEADLYTILESLGGGVAAFDYDGDGKVDLFFPGGGSFEGKTVRGRPGRLYRNLGDWKFADVTDAVGLAGPPVFYTHGTAVADYDRDGFPDLLVTGWDRVALYHNEPDGSGGRRFVERAAAAGLTDTRWATSAAWGDLDGDGFPDLYVCYYLDWSFANDPVCTNAKGERDVCVPQRFGPLQHRLYRNRGDGTFEDKTTAVGLRPDGKGLGVVIADLTADGKPDLYVANDATDNFLYRNLGGFRFEEVGRTAGVAVDDNGLYNGSMGVDAGDYDGTGRPAVWVTNFQGEVHALYRNAGGGRFQHHSQAAGLGRLGRAFVGFGTSLTDFDNDGWEDLVIANGHVLRRPVGATYRQRPVFLRNEEQEGRRQFREVPGQGGPYFRTEQAGRGLAVADLDNDGWPDVVISHQNDPVVVLRNVAWGLVGGHHWLTLSLRGKANRDVVGTTVTLEAGGRKWTRFVKGGGSYLSASDPRVRFGLGPATRITRITIAWAGGPPQVIEGLAANRAYVVREGQPAALVP